jgi:8-amino-7-oxononanoate synthase
MARKAFYDELARGLEALEAKARRRSLTAVARSDRLIDVAGQTLLNLAGNDYLALSQHAHLKQATRQAIDQDGVGAGASRLITGTLERHAALERRFARFKHAEAALFLPTGYMANLAAITALAGPGDLICLDKLNHASLIDAARLSGAMVRTYPHCHHEKLARLLERFANDDAAAGAGEQDEGRLPRAFIVTDSVFSMDGDVADLPALCDLAERYDAGLIVDEAHATGVLGASGAGLGEQQGVSDRVDVTVSTASKGLGGLGGIVTGPQVIVDTVINHARSAIYTTAAPPAQAAAIDAALDVIEREPERRARLTALADRLHGALADMGLSSVQAGAEAATHTPIVPIVVGEAQRALDLAAHLRARGILAAPIRYPTVPPGGERVRLSLRADLTDADVDQVCEALAAFGRIG